MSSIEMIEMEIAPVVNKRRLEISVIDAQLRDLNLIFPDERRKPDRIKDPEYLAQRSGILARRQFLSGMQRQDRKVLRGINR